MSHQSGFRRGGRDFTHREDPRTAPKGRGSRRFDQRLEQRFHDHERQAEETTPTEETTPNEEAAPTEDDSAEA